jgi:hypothetical protein
LRDALWAIVKDAGSRDTAAYRWARVRLGLVDVDDGLPPAAQRRADGHVCGWMQLNGTWQCVQDFYAEGWAPQTSCGATWEPSDTPMGPAA